MNQRYWSDRWLIIRHSSSMSLWKCSVCQFTNVTELSTHFRSCYLKVILSFFVLFQISLRVCMTVFHYDQESSDIDHKWNSKFVIMMYLHFIQFDRYVSLCLGDCFTDHTDDASSSRFYSLYQKISNFYSEYDLLRKYYIQFFYPMNF